MKLISSLTSPYGRKVRIVLLEKKIPFQLQVENPWLPDSKIGDVNPLGKVPVLVLEDGISVFDSRVIVEYLDMLSPVAHLIQDSARGRLHHRGRDRAQPHRAGECRWGARRGLQSQCEQPGL